MLGRALRIAGRAEDRGEALPSAHMMDQELAAISDVLATLVDRITPDRRAEAIGYIVKRLGLSAEVARIVLNSIDERAEA